MNALNRHDIRWAPLRLEYGAVVVLGWSTAVEGPVRSAFEASYVAHRQEYECGGPFEPHFACRMNPMTEAEGRYECYSSDFGWEPLDPIFFGWFDALIRAHERGDGS